MQAPDRRRLSRQLSALADATVAQILSASVGGCGICPVIGVAGAPGAGKSTLIGKLAGIRAATLAPLAIIAIDPSSPVSGGAILGDRVRMLDLADDPRIYIRSLATRTSHDGLADNLAAMLDCVASAGFAEIVTETTGVGQVDYAIRWLVDTMVLVSTPGAGDQIQAMKSGIAELPDIFVINKADQPGADQMVREIETVIAHRRRGQSEWVPPVLKTSADLPDSIAALSRAIDRHRGAVTPLEREQRMLQRQRQRLSSLIARRASAVLGQMSGPELQLPIAELYGRVAAALASTEVR